MAGVCNTKYKDGKHRAWYMDWQGKQVFFRGTTNKKETRRIADSKEDHQQRIKIGDIPPPKASDTPRDIGEVVNEYLDWGKAQGGHGGRAWSPVHVAMRTRHLTKFWPKQLSLTTLQDVTLPKVESICRALLEGKIVKTPGKPGKLATGKTVQSHVESIKALCLWAKSRGYLETNPLEGMSGFDTTPREKRRALRPDEIEQLLNAAPIERRLVYEVALCTGYRKGELTALKVHDLNVETCSLTLAAEHCKGRRASRQPIPQALASMLKSVSEGKAGTDPLLTVDFHIDRLFFRDLTAAKLLETAPGGKLVFHSLRHTYCSLVIESGASLTEAQRLLRHQDPKLTANVYSHARQDRLQSTAEAVGDKVIFNRKYADGMQRLAAGAETVDIKACNEMGLNDIQTRAGEGVRTLDFDLGNQTLIKPSPSPPISPTFSYVDIEKPPPEPVHSSECGIQCGFQIPPATLLAELKKLLASLPEDQRLEFLNSLKNDPSTRS
ncbi:MAG: site-specific integrase [Planctomycetota bacterium]